VKRLEICILTLVLAASALASDASISGTVRDPNGALVVNEAVVVTNTATRKKVTIKTDEAGSFGPVSLPEGEYKIQVRARCYKPYTNTIKLADRQASQLDVKLLLSCPKDVRVR
jgi:hypothetical protein